MIEVDDSSSRFFSGLNIEDHKRKKTVEQLHSLKIFSKGSNPPPPLELLHAFKMVKMGIWTTDFGRTLQHSNRKAIFYHKQTI